MKLSIVIPGLNVSQTIGRIVKELGKSNHVEEIIVVDNDSTDSTREVASRYGALVTKCSKRGLGHAMKCGIAIARNDLIMKVDGDIQNPSPEWVDLLVLGLTDGVNLVQGIYDSDHDEFPVANLVAKPAIKLRLPELSYVEMPLSGIYVFRRDSRNLSDLPDNWAFDLALITKSHETSGQIAQVHIGKLNDKKKSIVEYSDMAYDLLEFIFAGLR